METVGHIYRIRANNISIGHQNWPKGSLISGERLGPLVKYFKDLAMIEPVSFVRVDQIEEPHRKAA
jgi:hypothetical protein